MREHSAIFDCATVLATEATYAGQGGEADAADVLAIAGATAIVADASPTTAALRLFMTDPLVDGGDRPAARRSRSARVGAV